MKFSILQRGNLVSEDVISNRVDKKAMNKEEEVDHMLSMKSSIMSSFPLIKKHICKVKALIPSINEEKRRRDVF